MNLNHKRNKQILAGFIILGILIVFNLIGVSFYAALFFLISLGGVVYLFKEYKEYPLKDKIGIFFFSWLITYGALNIFDFRVPSYLVDFIHEAIMSLFFTTFLTFPLLCVIFRENHVKKEDRE